VVPGSGRGDDSTFRPDRLVAASLRKTQLSRDAIAGVTIWGLLIPEMIAYRQLTH